MPRGERPVEKTVGVYDRPAPARGMPRWAATAVAVVVAIVAGVFALRALG